MSIRSTPPQTTSALVPFLCGRCFLCSGVDSAQLSNAGPLVVVQGVAVLVHRDRRIGVAQQPGECHHVHPRFQGSCGEGVTERMKISVLDSRLPHTALEKVLVGAGFVGLSVFLARRLRWAAEVMEAAPAEVTEWKESIVHQLVEEIRVLSKDEIHVTFRNGTEITQSISVVCQEAAS